VSGRLHQKKLVAQANVGDAGKVELLSPNVGFFRPRILPGGFVTPGSLLGELEVLGVLYALQAPPEHGGLVVASGGEKRSRVPVAFGSLLYELDPKAVGSVATAETKTMRSRGLVFTASSSGRFYRRSAPDKAYFVEVGQSVSDGQTVGLLEVMKTFHRLTYSGASDGLPSPARVKAILVEDGADLEVGDAILEVDGD
jgi:acetyl-CoA carboxylase biotin carboxyl carrier protein